MYKHDCNKDNINLDNCFKGNILRPCSKLTLLLVLIGANTSQGWLTTALKETQHCHHQVKVGSKIQEWEQHP